MTAIANTSGSNNIIVQAIGTDIRVDVGSSHLRLATVTGRVAQQSIRSDREIDLLNPFQRTIPFTGRQADIDALWNWLHSPDRVSIRLLVGRAGAGKTRLAIELMDRLAGAVGTADWQAGFALASEMRRFAGQQNLSDWGWQRPTLVVVDYAAAVSAELRTWLEEIAVNPQCDGEGPPLRLLLLEREASADSGWFQSLLSIGNSFSFSRANDLFDPPEPVRISPLAEPAQRRAVLQSTLQAGADAFGLASPSLPEPGQSHHFDRRLADPLWADPLYLMMAAVLGLRTSVAEALALSRTSLAIGVAQREIQRVRRYTPNGAPHLAPLLVQVLAYATLAGGLGYDECREVADTEGDALGLQHHDGPGVLVSLLCDASPRSDGGVAPVTPDIIGEGVILEALRSQSPTKQSEMIVRAVKRFGAAVPPSVIRIAQDYAVQEMGVSGLLPLHWLETLVQAGIADNPDILLTIDAAMPRQTLALREQAARVTELLLERAVTAAEASAADAPIEIVALLNNLAVRLSELGRREEALDRAREAVSIKRELAAARPDAFLPDLAGSLNNLAIILGELGRREEALERVEEATRIYNQLAAARPEAFRPDLAMSLNTLAIRLSELGRREKALERAEEATHIYEQLAAARPDAFRPNLALSFNTLANCLSELGRHEEALERAEEAVRIRRELAAARPDAFRPDLAMSLNTLAIRLSELGHREKALERAEEAVNLYDQLAAARPDAFRPNLALSLNTLATYLNGLGRCEEALERAEEATRIFDQLAAARPDAFLPDLARSLATSGVCLQRNGRPDDAAAAFAESIKALSPLFVQLPSALGGLMRAIVQFYLEAVAACDTQPDLELLGPVIEGFQRMEQAIPEEQ